MQVGDSVYLKSGSPELKVVSIRDKSELWDGPEIAVEWEDDTQSICMMTLPEICLTEDKSKCFISF